MREREIKGRRERDRGSRGGREGGRDDAGGASDRQFSPTERCPPTGSDSGRLGRRAEEWREGGGRKRREEDEVEWWAGDRNR